VTPAGRVHLSVQFPAFTKRVAPLGTALSQRRTGRAPALSTGTGRDRQAASRPRGGWPGASRASAGRDGAEPPPAGRRGGRASGASPSDDRRGTPRASGRRRGPARSSREAAGRLEPSPFCPPIPGLSRFGRWLVQRTGRVVKPGIQPGSGQACLSGRNTRNKPDSIWLFSLFQAGTPVEMFRVEIRAKSLT
jgi:hypothetical protein